MINPESSLKGSSKPKIPKECAMLRPRCDLEPGKCQGSIEMSRCVKLQLQKLNIKLSSAGRPIIDPVTAKGIDVHLILVPLGDGFGVRFPLPRAGASQDAWIATKNGMGWLLRSH